MWGSVEGRVGQHSEGRVGRWIGPFIRTVRGRPGWASPLASALAIAGVAGARELRDPTGVGGGGVTDANDDASHPEAVEDEEVLFCSVASAAIGRGRWRWEEARCTPSRRAFRQPPPVGSSVERAARRGQLAWAR